MTSYSGSTPPAADQSNSSKEEMKPSSKDNNIIEDAKSLRTVSPGTKGTLDGYLVKTPDVKSPPSARLNKSKSRAKRILNLSAGQSNNLHPKDVQEEIEDRRRIPTETFSDDPLEKTGSVKELKRFAADFLSLYCGDLPSQEEQKTRGCKRNSSATFQSLSVELCSKKQRMKVLGDPLTELARTKSSEAIVSPFQNLNVVAADGEASSCIRKCSNTSSVSYEGAFGAPAFKASCNRKTPNSAYKSSLFSPGEEFWAEAIQVVDGFDACIEPSKPSKNTGNILKEVDDFSETRVDRLDVSLKVTGKIKENIAHCYVSPLPVKHFDFSHEQHNFDREKRAIQLVDEMKDTEVARSKEISVDFSHLAETVEDDHITNEKPNLIKPPPSVKESITTMKVEIPNLARKTPTVKDIRGSSGAGKGNNVAGTPSSTMPLKDCVRLNTWLPSEVCGAYMKKKISALYQWQVDCLQIDGVLEKRNLVFCASTSAGKSLVSEILMLRRVISTKKMALLVLPYVSICAEKAEHLESLLDPLGKHVRSFYGNQGGGSLPKDTSVAVCTIEKANSLINRLLEEGRLSEVGVVVIDELHMVGDQHRGYLLELLLTKLRYASGEGNTESSSEDSSGTNSGKSDSSHSLQIVGMSATMPNVAAVADWLQAALYQTEFRPVPLEEFIKVGNNIFNKKLDVIRKIPENSSLAGKDPDHIVKLCDEVVQEGHSVLIFCSSRKGCESTAKHVAKYLKQFTVESDDTETILNALRRCPSGLDPVLEETLPSGVAYHHAGLTVEEREIVESCYRSGLVRVLTATSTLAAGVNLPARRVIFRQAKIGRDFIDGTRYKQMSGRAGRTGIDSQGESILICKQEELKRIMSMLNDNCPPLQSCLSEDKNGMTHAILEVVAGGIVQTPNDINRYVRCTLLNSTRPFEAVVKSAQDSLRWLCRNKFLEWEEKSQLYTATPLGRASFGSSLNPEESLIVLDDLRRAREGFVLASDLHIVYIVTPINVDVEPDWELYYERFMELSSLDQSVGNRVGVTEPFLMRISHGAPTHFSERLRGVKTLSGRMHKDMASSSGRMLSDDRTLRVAKRFYVALMLSRLVQEVPMADVCDAFKVSRGMIQSLQENAGRFALMVSSFCERLGWHDLGGLVAKFQNRVSFGVRSEIAELTNIPYVKGSRARALYRAGLRTPQAIAEAPIPDIANALFESSSWSSHEKTAIRRVQLGMAKKIKNGARKIVLDQAEEARLAAFSAFKSLGVDIPQLSRPILPSDGQDNRPEFDGIQNKDSNTIKGDLSSNSSATKENEEVPAALMHVPVQYPKSDQDHFYGKHQISSSLNSNSQRKGPMYARSFSGGFDSFLNQWDELTEFYFDLHFMKKSEQQSHLPYEILGISVCWKESPVYYISLPKDLISSSSVSSQDNVSKTSSDGFWRETCDRWDKIRGIMGRFGVKKFTWNLKSQIQVLNLPGISVQKFGLENLGFGLRDGFKIVENSHILLPKVTINDGIDLCLVAWILWPDEESKSGPNLEKTTKKHLSNEVAAVATRDGKWRNQMRLVAYNGCCRRVSQIRALGPVLWNLLISEDLVTTLTDIESPLVKVLADMEHQGIGVDIEACLHARQILGKKVRELEKEAYRFAGKSFSLYTSADIADILYTHLKLPIPEGAKGKQHPSTDKHILDLLRCHHPIVPIIKEHRSLAKLLNSTLGSICSKAKLNVESQRYIVRGHWLQTSTATGRLSMEDPNLQCVEHKLEFTIDSSPGGHHQINARDFFVPTQEKWVLLVADYSQIELRLVAHFCRDSSLIDLLSKPDGDVFTMIAARWKGKSESVITSEEREHTKRLVYGILYGMGANSLAEQLDCGADEAAEKILSFKSSFPDVTSWLHEAVSSCRRKGYVETIKGRKRFLSKIQSGNKKEKAKAERQAVNSICQGSAADIIKIAMIKIHSVVSEDSRDQEHAVLRGRCHILLQVHDELVLEVDPSVVPEAGRLLQCSMESAMKLNVPLRVKMKVGRTWGSLKPLDVNLGYQLNLDT